MWHSKPSILKFVWSLVVNLSTSIGLFLLLSKIPHDAIVSNSILNDIFHATKIIKACQILHHHILALELDMDVFKEVLEPFIKVPIPKAKHPTMPLDYLDSKALKEELGLWINLPFVLAFISFILNFSMSISLYSPLIFL